MRNSVFAIVLLVLTLGCGPAWAEGPAAATYNWTGFYVGLNTGLSVDNSGYTLSPSGEALTNPFFIPTNPLRTDSGNFDGAGFMFGGQLGYNYQAGCFVYGIETDFDVNGMNDANSVNRALAAPLVKRIIHNVTDDVGYLGTLRGRFGYTAADRLLIYGTGGLAYGNVSSNSGVLFTSGGDTYVGSSSEMQAGWTLGAGAEYALNKNLSVKLEYLYVDLGSKSYINAGQPLPAFSYTTDLDTSMHVIRVGLNYRCF
ncbi:MAG: outer membrane protein [Syntrophobacteraceae bacterium]|jgi:outer membrane immunogenic protein